MPFILKAANFSVQLKTATCWRDSFAHAVRSRQGLRAFEMPPHLDPRESARPCEDVRCQGCDVSSDSEPPGWVPSALDLNAVHSATQGNAFALCNSEVRRFVRSATGERGLSSRMSSLECGVQGLGREGIFA